jgi:hypothetical protein
MGIRFLISTIVASVAFGPMFCCCTFAKQVAKLAAPTFEVAPCVESVEPDCPFCCRDYLASTQETNYPKPPPPCDHCPICFWKGFPNLVSEPASQSVEFEDQFLAILPVEMGMTRLITPRIRLGVTPFDIAHFSIERCHRLRC